MLFRSVLLGQAATLLVRVEIAVRTFANAPRDVDVERKRWQDGEIGAEHRAVDQYP